MSSTVAKSTYDALLEDRNRWMREARKWRAEACDAMRRIREAERAGERRGLNRARDRIFGGAA